MTTGCTYESDFSVRFIRRVEPLGHTDEVSSDVQQESEPRYIPEVRSLLNISALGGFHKLLDKVSLGTEFDAVPIAAAASIEESKSIMVLGREDKVLGASTFEHVDPFFSIKVGSGEHGDEVVIHKVGTVGLQVVFVCWNDSLAKLNSKVKTVLTATFRTLVVEPPVVPFGILVLIRPSRYGEETPVDEDLEETSTPRLMLKSDLNDSHQTLHQRTKMESSAVPDHPPPLSTWSSRRLHQSPRWQ